MAAPPMLERGRVIHIESGTATIEMETSDACIGCTICRDAGGTKRLMEVGEVKGLREGQLVTVEISSRWALGTLFLVFIVPLLAFLIGAVAGRPILGSIGVVLTADAAALVVGGSLFIITLALALVFSRLKGVVRRLTPRIVRTD